VLLGPVQSELLAPEAVERFCELIRGWARDESAQVGQGTDPSIAAIDTEIADLEALIEARPERAATIRPLIAEVRAKKATLRPQGAICKRHRFVSRGRLPCRNRGSGRDADWRKR
jgi:hypothetical protein